MLTAFLGTHHQPKQMSVPFPIGTVCAPFLLASGAGSEWSSSMELCCCPSTRTAIVSSPSNVVIPTVQMGKLVDIFIK